MSKTKTLNEIRRGGYTRKLTAIIIFFLAVMTSATLLAKAPELPDLSVLFIQRLPRNVDVKFDYPNDIPAAQCSCLSQVEPGRGAFTYKPDPKPSDKPAFEMTDAELKDFCRHRPLPGDTIFFTAHVKNQGGAPSPKAPYVFSIDNKAVLDGEIPRLAPGEKTTVSTKWTWESGDHTVNFKVTPQAKEICDKNDERDILADAVSLVICAGFLNKRDREVYDAFAATPNMIGSYSFEDWCQHHIDVWNENLGKAVYPSTPNGVSERIRFDGIFSADDPELPERVHWQLSYPIDRIPHMATVIDGGLIHELMHQCGIIDLYAMFFMSTANLVRGDDGKYLFIGHNHGCVGLMGGGSASNPDTFISEHSAAGLERMKGWPRGGYGIYMFELPKHNVVRLLDHTGKPLVGAKVLLHRAARTGKLGKLPPIEYKANSKGEIDLGGFPFELIHVVGRTANSMLEIRFSGQLEYHFIDLVRMNIAYWRGDTERHVYEMKTNLAPKRYPAAPSDLKAEILSPKRVRLTWNAGKDPDSFRILRNNTRMDCSLDPPFKNVLELSGEQREAEIELKSLSVFTFFTVAAVDEKGRQGAYSNVLRVPDYEIYPYLVRPWGVARDGDGTVYTFDNHSGVLYSVDKDGRQTGWGDVIRAGPGHPAGLAVSADGTKLYLGNRRSGSIIVTDISRKRITGAIGRGLLKRPWGVAVSKDGTIFAADTDLSEVVIFDESGKKIGSIQGFNKPRAIAYDDSRNLICVGDSDNDQVKIYSYKSAEPKLELTIDDVLNAECVAFGPRERIYVGHDTRLGKCRRGMTVYNKEGKLIGEWLQKPFAYRFERFVYGLAVAPNGDAYLTHGANERWLLRVTPDEIRWLQENE